MTGTLMRERQREVRDRGEGKGHGQEGHVKKRAEIRGMLPRPRDTWSHEKPKRHGRILPRGPQREHGPASLDFRLLASHTVRDYVSGVLSHQACGNLSPQPSEANTDGQLFTVAGIRRPLCFPFPSALDPSHATLHLWQRSQPPTASMASLRGKPGLLVKTRHQSEET